MILTALSLPRRLTLILGIRSTTKTKTMEKRHGLMMNKGRSNRWRSYMIDEFGEEDVWDVMNGDPTNGFGNVESRGTSLTSPLSVSRRLPSAARMIPTAQRHHQPNHGDGDDDDDDDESKVMPHSAPVNIPDWSKIYGNGKTLMQNGACASNSTHYDNDDDYGDGNGYDDDGYGDGDGDGRLPPHEWLARKLARSQISTFSVCEGAGRTLKGRDLSRVRNAILSKTGFI